MIQDGCGGGEVKAEAGGRLVLAVHAVVNPDKLRRLGPVSDLLSGLIRPQGPPA